MDSLYRDEILEHYRRPHHFGLIADATFSREGSNQVCGDRINLQLRIADGRVVAVGFTGRGCAISQAAASMLSDEIDGQPLERVRAFDAQRVLELLAIEISPARQHCALLALETLQDGLSQGENEPGSTEPGSWSEQEQRGL